MRTTSFIISLLFAGLFYAGLVYYYKKKVIYSDENTQDKCKNTSEDVSKFVDGSECHVWDDHNCRRGKYDKASNSCVSKGDYIPLALLLLSIAFAISSILSIFL